MSKAKKLSAYEKCRVFDYPVPTWMQTCLCRNDGERLKSIMRGET